MDIAQKAKVTPATVSLALRNRPEVSQATQKRIQKIAERMGYTPDPIARAFSAYRKSNQSPTNNGNLAFLTRFPTEKEWTDHMPFRMYWKGAEAESKKLGYQLTHFWLNQPDMTMKRASQILYNKGAKGILLGAVPLNMSRFDLNWDLFCPVVLGSNLKKPLLNTIQDDHFYNMALMWKQLKALKYKRIGLMLQREANQRHQHQWLASYLVESYLQCEAGTDIPPLLFETLDESNFRNWQREHKPDVIISHTSHCYQYLRKIGVRVPEDIGYASLFTWAQSPVSGVRQNLTDIGRGAVELLDLMIQKNKVGIPRLPQIISIKGQWHPGKTLKRQRKKR